MTNTRERYHEMVAEVEQVLMNSADEGGYTDEIVMEMFGTTDYEKISKLSVQDIYNTATNWKRKNHNK